MLRFWEIPYITLNLEDLADKVSNLQAALNDWGANYISHCKKPFDNCGNVPIEASELDLSVSKYPLCTGTVIHELIGEPSIFISIAGKQTATEQCTFEEHFECTLKEIPTTLLFKGRCYILRGVIAFIPPGNLLTMHFKNVSIGHYVSYSRRIGGGNWFRLDDLKTTPQFAQDTMKVKLEMVLYTVHD